MERNGETDRPACSAGMATQRRRSCITAVTMSVPERSRAGRRPGQRLTADPMGPRHAFFRGLDRTISSKGGQLPLALGNDSSEA